MPDRLCVTSRYDISEPYNLISLAATEDGLTFSGAEGILAEYTDCLKLIKCTESCCRYSNIAYSPQENSYYVTTAGTDGALTKLSRGLEALGEITLNPSPGGAITGIGVRNDGFLVGTFSSLFVYGRDGGQKERLFDFGNALLNYACTAAGNTTVCAVGTGGGQRLVFIGRSGREEGSRALPQDVFVRALTACPARHTVLRLLASVPGSRNSVITLSAQRDNSSGFFRRSR